MLVPAHFIIRFQQYLPICFFFFFFNDTATTEIYTLSLHDALPISPARSSCPCTRPARRRAPRSARARTARSEEHTSELQSHSDLVCRLLLEKKKKNSKPPELDELKRPLLIDGNPPP